MRYRLILVRASDLDWLRGDRLKDLQAQATAGHKWIPAQQLPYNEIILYAYAADRTNRPTCVCLPSGLYNARTGRVLAQAGPEQEITPASTFLMDGGYTLGCQSPTTCHERKRRQFKVSPSLLRHLIPNLPGRRRKKRETSWLQLPRISLKMGQAQEEQQSARASICGRWSTNMSPPSKQCI